jgi:hypothetical protein
MFGWLRFTLKHPLYPDLSVTPAAGATGRHIVLAGSLQQLAQAASRGACASHAVFVVCSEEEPLPGADEREQLWQWFRVPSYALVLDANGRLQAYECEAQEGLHLAGDRSRTGETDAALCPCGRPGPKVNQPAKRWPQAARQLPPVHSLSA